MVLFVFQGRFFMMRMLLLAAAAGLVSIGILTIYAIGHPAPLGEKPEITSTKSETISNGQNIDGNNNTPAADSQIANLKPQPPNKYSNKWEKQILFALAGLICLAGVNTIHYRRLGPVSYGLYGVILCLLALLLAGKFVDLPFVHHRFGRHRWFKVGFGFMIQPSEFCKIAYILALAWYLRFRSNFRTFRGLIGPFALTLLAMALILLEPDLGTSLVLMPILFCMLFAAGARVKHLAIILLLGVAVSPLMWKFMRQNQRMRISSVLLQNKKIMDAAKNNEKLANILVGDPDNLRTWERGDGYQLLHAKRAIASGGLGGYGFGKGPYLQNQKYLQLPEADNDMIFPVIAHQFGIWGCSVVLILYAVIIAGAVDLAWLNTDPFGRLVAAGIAAMFAVQVLVNVGMVLGMMPITGLTLPLVSYGGSSMVANLIAIGLLNNIGRHRPFSVAKRPFEY
jgi:cell division protein FtsW (lipid II flippase)